MPFKISFSKTWISWLSHCIIFQIRKRNNKLTDYQICCLLFGFFLLDQSKNNAVPEPRTGHFRGLVGFEAKAKDLSFEAQAKYLSFEAKDLKMCPRGQERPRRLHLWCMTPIFLVFGLASKANQTRVYRFSS